MSDSYKEFIKVNAEKLMVEGKKYADKYKPLLEGIEDEYTRIGTAILMENEVQFADRLLTESTTSGSSIGTAGQFIRYALPIIRRVFPNLIANKLVGVQPLMQPVGFIFYLRYKFAETRGTAAANAQMNLYQNAGLTGTTPYNVGGIPAGSGPYVLATIQDLFEELLYPYVHPTFSAFGLTGITVLEVGDSIDGAAQAITWTTTTPGNVAVNSIDIDDVTGAVNLETGLANSGTVNHDFSGAGAIVFNVAATNQFLITGTDTDPAGPSNFTRTFGVYWQWRKYVGDQAGAGNLAGAAIQALSIYNAVNTTCAGTYSFGAAATYKTFAFPALWVQPVSFKDLATGFNVPMEASYNVAAGGAMNNAFGQSPAGG